MLGARSFALTPTVTGSYSHDNPNERNNNEMNLKYTIIPLPLSPGLIVKITKIP